MAFKAIEPGSIPGGHQFFNLYIVSDGGSERGAVIFSNAPIIFNISLIYIFFSGEAKAVCIGDPSHKTNNSFTDTWISLCDPAEACGWLLFKTPCPNKKYAQ